MSDGIKIVEFPNNLADVPRCLRNLADAIAEGHFGEVSHVAYAIDASNMPISTGLIGQCANPDCVAITLFEAGKLQLIKDMGK